MLLTQRVTLKDLARQAGVSHTAVSQALRGRGDLRPELAARIRQLAEAAHYAPRLAAQHLRAGRTGQVGIVMAMPDARAAFGAPSLSSLLGAVVWECDRAGRRYVLEFTPRDASAAFVPPSQVTGQTVDGTILIGDTGDHLRDWLSARRGFPWISIEEPAPHCVAGRMDAGIEAAVRRLHAGGHRRIAYAGGPQIYLTHRLGLQGYRRACRRHALRAPAAWQRLFAGNDDAEQVGASHAWATALLAAASRPTAFVCHGDVLARNVILAACERGLRVPADLSVVSCGPVTIAHHYHPRLATIELDYGAMAGQAMAVWQDLVEERAVPRACRWVAPRLIEGDTLGHAPRTPKTRARAAG